MGITEDGTTMELIDLDEREEGRIWVREWDFCRSKSENGIPMLIHDKIIGVRELNGG